MFLMLLYINNSLSMPEVHEYEDDTIPRHVAHFLRQQAQTRAINLLERQERKRLDDDEAREREPGQVYTSINLFS